MSTATAEDLRLRADRSGTLSWRAWGPYVSERQWGTVREDYSRDGSAWDYFPFDHAGVRAYRWGEDGIAGWCDREQRLTLSLALWNGHDPILKERLFGLTNAEGNHGEDVKELVWYLDATPSHAWQRMLYKYPQAEFPYRRLREENARRGRRDPEFELIDTGLFDEGRYFDVEIAYAKPEADAVVMRVIVTNRGPDTATLEVIPQLCFRNTWSWTAGGAAAPPKPSFRLRPDGRIDVRHPRLDPLAVTHFGADEILCCENETDAARLWGTTSDGRPKKGGIEAAIVRGERSQVVATEGTKVALRHRLTIPPGESGEVLVHLGPDGDRPAPTVAQARAVIAARSDEAERWWATVQAGISSPEQRAIQRAAFAGLLWSKQFYRYDVRRWLAGDPGQPPPPPERRHGRNAHWQQLSVKSVLIMPDKWEYPWFAAWDHAFHAVACARIDPELAKQQIASFLTDAYVHPNGALPAYEWAFDDANPPIMAWAAWRVYQIDRKLHRRGDLDFLVHVLNRLAMNFTWWVNRKDADGRNVFEGGFLGLDNIGVFDRSRPLPTGGRLQQADGTAWVGMYALSLMQIAIELSLHFPVYQDLAIKFFEHFLQIALAMTDMGGTGTSLWSEEHGFHFDRIRLPDGHSIPLEVFSVVGLTPLFCVETIEPETLAKLPQFAARLEWVFRNRPELSSLVSRWNEPGRGDRRLLSLLRGHRMKALLRKALDPNHFLSDFGLRGLSKVHQERPYELRIGSESYRIGYEPGEGETDVYGGNSNWRGPIWLPLNYLLVESLQKFHHYYGDDFRIECPVGSSRNVTLSEAADELSRRLVRIFERGRDGHRPVLGSNPLMQRDPHFRDHLPFFEFFHGETGAGLGARCQTGWTALVGKLLFPRGTIANPSQ